MICTLYSTSMYFRSYRQAQAYYIPSYSYNLTIIHKLFLTTKPNRSKVILYFSLSINFNFDQFSSTKWNNVNLIIYLENQLEVNLEETHRIEFLERMRSTNLWYHPNSNYQILNSIKCLLPMFGFRFPQNRVFEDQQQFALTKGKQWLLP